MSKDTKNKEFISIETTLGAPGIPAEQQIKELRIELEKTQNLVLRIAECLRCNTGVNFFAVQDSFPYFGPGGMTGNGEI